MVDDLGQRPQPHVRAHGASPLGKQGPHLTDGPGNCGAVHAEPAGQHVVGGPVAKMDQRGQQPVDEHQPCFAPAPRAPFRGLDASLAWCRSCHNGPTSKTSSAITSADRQVIRRLLTITARDALSTT